MTKKQLLEKSRNYRNEQAIQKLAQRDSLIKWSNTKTTPIPKTQKIEIQKDKVGWYNFFKLILELKP